MTEMTGPAPLSFELPGGVYNATPPRIVFGLGTRKRIGAEIDRLGCRRAVIVSTPGRAEMARAIATEIGPSCVGVLAEAVSQVPIELAQRARLAVRELGADCIVSIGGGASVGLGKAIALELALPIIAVPTTYSGSEMTGFCGITIDGIKRMHTSLDMLAATVVYDAELSLGLPTRVSAASAMNALAHCVDAVYVATASPVIKQSAILGAGAVMSGLRRVLRSPSDPAARSELLYGAYLAGAALTGGFALQHGLAHTLGGSYGIEHGLSHALVLPHVAAYNGRFAPEVTMIAEAIGAKELGGAIFDLLSETGLPTSLAAIDFSPGELDRAARITVETDNGLNPAPVTHDVVRKILDQAFAGRRPA
ncbi:maleylacetate reductase [Aureimonas glaciei]|uniref:Maleylacetate reductase n=1 Tax=Aureimonas glaciei TaxID=1776957 RepID=A0A916YCP9_9HYPH|nr:maleylacetate reductase [Aureimonas glaciei]GGD39973.1 maleylacetate reductase [Aureimonas glaciei]